MPQEISEILKRVERIQIVANRMVSELVAGNYRAVFRGQGMEFQSVREYQPGDEIRTIDWNVTARAGSAFVKQFREERELTVLFLVDISASGSFGSTLRSKLDLVIEVAALLMFSAIKNNDRVGLVTFCDRVRDYAPPGKGKAHVLRLIRQLVALEPVPGATVLEAPLEFVSRVVKRTAVVFLISDFLAPSLRRPGAAGALAEGGTKATPALSWPVLRTMAICRRRHDLIAVTVSDPRERALPDVGLVSLRDAETGRVVSVDTGHPRVRALFARGAAQRAGELSRSLRKAGVDELALRTDESYLASLRRFFRMRERRLR